MGSNWPQSIDDFGQVTGGEATNQPNTAGLTHAGLHNLLADAVTKLETNLQVTASSYIPADTTGSSSYTLTPDPISSVNSATIVQTPGQQSILGTKYTGNPKPSFILDTNGQFYWGDGVEDPTIGGAQLLIYQNPDGTLSPGLGGGRGAGGGSQDSIIIGYSNGVHIFPFSSGISGGPNTHITSYSKGDIVIDQDTPAIWQSTVNNSNSSWVQIGSSNSPLYAETATTGAITAFGYNALGITTIGGTTTATGIGLTAIGNFSGGVTSGSGNTTVGYNVGTRIGAGSNNTAVGAYCLQDATPSDNTAIGSYAISVGVGASADTAIGEGTLFYDNGNNNVAVGYYTMCGPNSSYHLPLPTGIQNVAIGTEALRNYTTASNNVAIGYLSMYGVDGTASTGVFNTAVGYLSLNVNTTGYQNTAIGYNSLSSLTTGRNNDALGSDSLNNITTGGFNAAIGAGTLQQLTGSSSYNVAVGNAAFSNPTSGTGNTIIGVFADGSVSAPTLNYTTALGYSTQVGADGAVAIGTDHTGAGAQSATQDLIVLGTSNHTLSIPGAISTVTSNGISLQDSSNVGVFINEADTSATSGGVVITDHSQAGMLIKEFGTGGLGLDSNSGITIGKITGTYIEISNTSSGDITLGTSGGTVKMNGAQIATVIENINTVSTSGTAQTIPDVTSDTINYITLTANCTLTFPTAAAGKSFLLGLLQDGTGSRTVTWPGTVKWAGGTAPTLTTAASKLDVFSFVCLDGTNWVGVTAGQNF